MRERGVRKRKAGGEGGSQLIYIYFSLLHSSTGDSGETERELGRNLLQGNTH